VSDIKNPVPSLVENIRSNNDLNRVSAAFIALAEATGVPFRMFDLEQVEAWCKQNGSKCK